MCGDPSVFLYEMLLDHNSYSSFGVGISKVRSLYLDALDAEQVRVMLALGNRAVNAAYEATVPENEHDVVPPRALPSSAR